MAGNERLPFGVQFLAEYKQYHRLDLHRIRPLSLKRDACKRHCFTVPYQNIEIDRIRSDYLARSRLAPHPIWNHYEVLDGMLVEFSPILSYYTMCFLDCPDITFWHIFSPSGAPW